VSNHRRRRLVDESRAAGGGWTDRREAEDWGAAVCAIKMQNSQPRTATKRAVLTQAGRTKAFRAAPSRPIRGPRSRPVPRRCLKPCLQLPVLTHCCLKPCLQLPATSHLWRDRGRTRATPLRPVAAVASRPKGALDPPPPLPRWRRWRSSPTRCCRAPRCSPPTTASPGQDAAAPRSSP
jgi:hypothetical protein